MTSSQLDDRRRENTLLRCVLFTFFVSGAACQALGPLIPFFRESYGVSYKLSGLMLSMQSAGNLAAVLLSGLLPVWLGRRRSILATGVWMAAGYLIFVLGLGHPAALLLGCLMTGVAKGGNANFSNTMVSTLPADKAARGYNLLHGAFAVGALLSPLLLVALTALAPGWGWRFMAGALLALCLAQLAVYLKMALPPEPARRGRQAVELSFLRDRRFWSASLILFFYISTEYAITGWLVTYFQDVGVLDPGLSQMMSSLLWLMIFLGRMVGAAISGRVSRHALLILDGLGLLAAFLVMFFSRSSAVVIPALAAVGLCMATVYPTAYALGSECIRGNDLGNSVLILTGSVGGVIAPALVGFVAGQTGSIQSGMAVVAVCVALLLVFILLSAVMSGRRR